MAILAIDQGTSGSKAILLSDDFQVLARGYAPLDVEHNQSGMSQTTATQMWQSIVLAISQVVKDHKVKIKAVGLANQGESILAWDKKNGQALTPIIVWQDSRSAALCDERKEHSKFILAKTGLTIDPYFVAPKITWLRDQYPQLPASAVVTTTDSWLIYQLTKQFVTDKATASRTLLFDLASKGWQQQQRRRRWWW